jgi:carbamoyltransferase
MLILGLNMFHADASAAIVLDGEVKFAIAEERLNRHKHFGGFPRWRSRHASMQWAPRFLTSSTWPSARTAMRILRRKFSTLSANPAKILNFIRLRQRKEGMRDVRSLVVEGSRHRFGSQLRFQEHHLEHHIAHIASAYYCSPWEKAAGFQL